MSPKKMIGLSFAAPAAKLCEAFDKQFGADAAWRPPPVVVFVYISSTASMSGSAVRSPRRSPGCSGVRLWMGMSAQ